MAPTEGLCAILSRFPDQRDKLQRLFERSASFQSLCDDHMRCAEALRYWQQSVADEAPARREEYARLLKDLEAEIQQSLVGAE